MNLHTIPPHVPFLDALACWWLEQRGDDPLAVADGLILLPTRRAARAPHAPSRKGEARWTTSGRNHASARSTSESGRPTRKALYDGSATDRVRTTGTPR